MEPERLADVLETCLVRALAPIVARVAALEARPIEPGPAGPQGPAGRDGTNGTNGIDGLTGQDGIAGKDGSPGLRYCGIFVEGQAYEGGDVVTHGGSAFYCHAATTARPGETSAGWQLMVKRGRDGRDLREPAPAR